MSAVTLTPANDTCLLESTPESRVSVGMGIPQNVEDKHLDPLTAGAPVYHTNDPSQSHPTYKYPALAIRNPLIRECLAELMGTFILICFGDGVVAQVVLFGGDKGGYLSINLCWGLGVMFGIHFAGGVSGAHLNPAVTFALAVFKRFEWRKVLPYVLSQIIGAFLGAFCVYMCYYQGFQHAIHQQHAGVYDENTAGIFATYPGSGFVNNYACFITEVFGTALLMGGIFAIGDELNQPASRYSKAPAVALLVVAIGMAFGANSGYAINPARDFGPRLFSACAGWGSMPFTKFNYYFWIPIVAPLIGAVLGGGVYELMVETHHPIFQNNEVRYSTVA